MSRLFIRLTSPMNPDQSGYVDAAEIDGIVNYDVGEWEPTVAKSLIALNNGTRIVAAETPTQIVDMLVAAGYALIVSAPAKESAE